MPLWKIEVWLRRPNEEAGLVATTGRAPDEHFEVEAKNAEVAQARAQELAGPGNTFRLIPPPKPS